MSFSPGRNEGKVIDSHLRMILVKSAYSVNYDTVRPSVSIELPYSLTISITYCPEIFKSRILPLIFPVDKS